MNRVVLLGPQRHAITVTTELQLLATEGRVAAITAGWQEREAEDDELQDAIGHRAVNLELHRRTDEIFAEDRELFEANRGRQDKLRQLQEIYRVRLGFAKAAARELMAREGADELLGPERAAAMAQLRDLDQHHLGRLREVHAEFEARWAPLTRPALARHHEELRQLMADCSVVAIAGGHVATLLGRIRLLGIDRLLGDRAVMAWSAGAMVCMERVVLFHDRPPEGAGNAEILDMGLGLVPGLVVFPHASRRLRTDDPGRMSLLSNRFAPAQCVCLDPRDRLAWDGRGFEAGPTTRRIAGDGTLQPMAEVVA